MGQIEDQVARMDEPSRIAGLYLMDLVRVALVHAWGDTSVQAPVCPESTTWGRVFALAHASSVEGVSWAGAAPYADRMPPELAEAWRAAADATLWRRLQFDVERECVLAALIDEGATVLPLKGAVTANLYPDPTMRSMCDNDILYRFEGLDERSGTERAVRIMEGLGFTATHVGMGAHDCFEKPPCFGFELHRALFKRSSERMERVVEFFSEPWARAVSTGEPGVMAFSPRDQYLFHVAHAFKHFDNSGCGVRCLVDEAVFLHVFGDEVSESALAGDLACLGEEVRAFERDLRACAVGLMEGGSAALDGSQRDLVWYLLGCGTYGNLRTRVDRAMGREREAGRGRVVATARYLWSRLTLSDVGAEQVYPIVGRHPVLKPFVVPYRVLRAATVRLPVTLRELSILRRRG